MITNLALRLIYAVLAVLLTIALLALTKLAHLWPAASFPWVYVLTPLWFFWLVSPLVVVFSLIHHLFTQSHEV